jgi:hypothetical protein
VRGRGDLQVEREEGRKMNREDIAGGIQGEQRESKDRSSVGIALW